MKPGEKAIVEGRGSNAIKIIQRLPVNNLPHSEQISRLANRLIRKYQVGGAARDNGEEGTHLENRDNTYTVITAAVPSQSNSAGIDQDGTDYSYFAPVEFGSAQTKLYMLLDTGADQSWVMSSTCTSGPCKVHNLYNVSASSSAKTLPDTLDIQYGSGSVSGLYAVDTISFAGLSFPLTFGLANNTSDDFFNFPIDGILALSLAQSDHPSFMETLVASKALKSNIFGISLNRMSDGPNTGEINFGAPDTSKFTGSLNYVSVNITGGGGNWAIPLESVGFAKARSGLTGRLAYLDTGTSFIFCPPEDAKIFHALIPGATSADNITYHVPCTTTGSLTFTFGGTAYSVPTEDWLGPMVGGVCTSNVYGRTVIGANWLVGDTFLKNVYAVFDADKTRIGLAPAAIHVVTSTAAASAPTATTSASSGGASPTGLTTGTAKLPSSTNKPDVASGATTSATGTAAAEAASASATATQSPKSGAKRLDSNFALMLLAAVVLVKNMV